MTDHTRFRWAGPALALTLALVTAACGTTEDTAATGQGQAVGAAADDGATDDTTGDTTQDTTETTTGDDSGDEPDDSDDSGGDESDDSDDSDEDDSGGGIEIYDTGDITYNECPAAGCLAQITGAQWNGEEIDLSLDANFQADTDGNHFHIYWNNWKPEEVSHDNAKGSWVATASYPVYNTGEDSTTKVGSEFQGDANEICVTPADMNHIVIDPANYACWPVPERS